jgi:hypothetical protein
VTAPEITPELPGWWLDLCARTAAELAAPDPYQPDLDRTPTPFAARQAEMEDLRAQGANPLALWTATTIPTKDYL